MATACAGDETLRAEVESLLGAHAGPGPSWRRPAVAETGRRAGDRAAADWRPPSALGRRIGPYRILRELGHGGMGVVYLAERADAAFEKQVAIKVVRGGFAGRVARGASGRSGGSWPRWTIRTSRGCSTAGTTDDGLPYLVMEYVDGMPMDATARRAALGSPTALRAVPARCARPSSTPTSAW